MVDNNIWASHNSSSFPDFGLDASPNNLSVSPANLSGNFTVKITRLKGFSATVTLSVVTSSSAVTCTLTPSRLYMGGSDTSTLSCHGALGTYTLTAEGNSGYSTHTKTVNMVVAPASAAASTQPSNPLQMILVYAGIGAAILVALLAAILFLRRKKPEPMVAPSQAPLPPNQPDSPGTTV